MRVLHVPRSDDGSLRGGFQSGRMHQYDDAETLSREPHKIDGWRLHTKEFSPVKQGTRHLGKVNIITRQPTFVEEGTEERGRTCSKNSLS